jgi:ArsR family transcriptional regulator
MESLTLFKCLSEPTRLTVMLLLTQHEELCVCEFSEALAESQPKISRHLALLRECSLIQDRRQGQWVFYRLNDSLPRWAADILQNALEAEQQTIKPNNRALKSMQGRPQRCCD